jgi:hypothetical protein
MFLRRAAPITASAAPERPRTSTLSPYATPRSVIGSAKAISVQGITQTERPYTTWQEHAWTGYEKVGEIHYGVDTLAKLMSRLRIYAGVVLRPDDAPMEAKAAAEDKKVPTGLAEDAALAVAELTRSGLPEMLRSYALNISVPADCYLVRMPDPQPRKLDPAQPDVPTTYTWVIRSTDEVKVRLDSIEVTSTRGATNSDRRVLPGDTYIARIWKSSPRYSGEPDSSMIGIADAVEELLLLSRVTRASARSRLGAGLIFVPDSVTVASAPQADGTINPNPTGTFLNDFMDSILTPISDEGSAAGVVPMLVTGPAEQGEKIRHITFQRDEKSLTEDKKRALDRILQGLDIPKEIVTGLADVKYSNALVIDQNLFKANVEPLALLFVDSMTTVFLRPILRALKDPRTGKPRYSEDDLSRIVLWYDPSEIVTQPDAAADATEGYNLGLLSGDAWRTAHGYGSGDGPSEQELAYMMVTRSGTTLPEDVLQTLLQRVFPDILGKARAEAVEKLPVEMPRSALKLLQPDAPEVTPDDDAPPAATAASGARR